LIEDNLSWYEMLFISKAGRSTLEQDLRQIDQGTGHVILLGELGKDSSKPQAGAPNGARPPAAPAASGPAAKAAPAAPTAHSDATAAVKSPSVQAQETSASAADTSAPAASLQAAAPAARSATPAAASASSNVIRVPGEMLDQFMNQIGEMVLVRGQLAHIIGDHRVRDGLQRLRYVQEC
jgi:two-component system, chemotaxis family, sensor kinase CheA